MATTHPPLPKHLEQICSRAGSEWADTTRFHVVVNWLNATPAAPQPPLRFLLNLTALLAGKGNEREAPDLLQSFWYDGRNGYQMRVRGYYRPPSDSAGTDIGPYFWFFLTGGLRQFCARTAGQEKKKRQTWVLDSESGAARFEPVQSVPLEKTAPDGSEAVRDIPDPDPARQPEAAALRDLLSEPVQEALNRLSSKQREVLIACLDEDADRAKIAQRLQMTVGNLNVIFLRAKRLMRDALETQGREDAPALRSTGGMLAS